MAGTKDVRIVALTETIAGTRAALFSPDASTVVSLRHSRENHIKVWNASTLAPVKSMLELIPYPLANKELEFSWITATFSHEGSKIAIGLADETVRLWDCMTTTLLLGPLQHAPEICYGNPGLAFSRDGTKIVLGCGISPRCGLVRMWDTTTGAHLLTLFGHTNNVFSVAFSPDESYIVSGSADTTVRVWDASTGQLLEIFSGHAGVVPVVSFSPNGSQIASGSTDHTVRLWDVATGKPLIHPLAHTSTVLFVKFFAGGTQLLSGSFDGTIRLWEIAKGTLLQTILTHDRSLCFDLSHDECSLVLLDSQLLQIWDVSNLVHVPEPISAYTGGFAPFMFSPNGVKLALRSNEGEIWVENVLTGVRSFPPFRSNINCVGFSLDGTRIASGSSGTSLQLWDALTGASLLGPIQCPSRPRYGSNSIDENSAGLEICAVAFSLDGSQIASGLSTGELWIISALTGVTLLEPKKIEDKAIISLAFSPDGARIVALSKQSSIRVLHAITGELIQTWAYCGSKRSLRQAPSISSLGSATGRPRRAQSFHLLRNTHAFDSLRRSRSLDSRRVPSQLADVKLSSALPKFMTHSLNPPDPGDSRAFAALSPDESKIIAGLPDRSIRIWDLSPPAHIVTSVSGTLTTSGAQGPVDVGKTIVVIPKYIKDYRLCMIEKEVVVFSIFLRQFFVIDLSPYM